MTKHIIRELEHIEHLANRHADIELTTLANIKHKAQSFPLYALHVGTKDPNAPTLFLTGSIHGVERIGSQIILAFLENLLKRTAWDVHLNDRLSRMNIISIPVINPWGVHLKTRSNGNGVDLMRNSPIQAKNPKYQLYAGHAFSNKLPWYRGNPNQMEHELIAVSEFILERSKNARSSIILDLHSGFGTRDRLWFPFAHSSQPPDNLHEYYLLYRLFRKSYPQYELYQFEPQWHQYTTHGDFWDWMYQQHFAQSSTHFLPITLELGSWLWVKKNPWQLMRFSELFHPTKPHRVKRVQRRHNPLLNYLIQVLDNDLFPKIDNEKELTEKALKLWYP